MNLHKAIRAIYNSVANINGNNQTDIKAWDNQGNIIDINWSLVNNWTDPEQYKIDRASEYPSMADQLDDIFHNGIDGWKATIQAIKDKYPKE